MLKELIAIGMATTLITAPPQNTNDGTYYQDVNITESYEYETNEVNSINDLVVGNIYKLTYENVNSGWYALMYCQGIYYGDVFDAKSSNSRQLVVYNLNDNTNTDLYYRLDASYYCYYHGDFIQTLECYVVYDSIISGRLNASNFTASDFLGEKTITVERVETEGLYNLAYHFLYSRIYTNTELQTMETTLFGTTINMNMWLSHTTAIVIICLLLVVLIKFVIWLFKIVSGGMLWK